MKLIIISGPSGSGKTTLSKKILKKLKDGVILNTDNYYKTGVISLILSKIIPFYFDRIISFNNKLFKKDIDFILKNGYSNITYKYDFKNKSIIRIFKKIKNIRFLIIEGIFGTVILNYLRGENCILIKLNTSKRICKQRVIKRDYLERGKSKKRAQSDFLKAWEIFNKNKSKIKKYQKKFIINNDQNLNVLIKRIIKLTS